MQRNSKPRPENTSPKGRTTKEKFIKTEVKPKSAGKTTGRRPADKPPRRAASGDESDLAFQRTARNERATSRPTRKVFEKSENERPKHATRTGETGKYERRPRRTAENSENERPKRITIAGETGKYERSPRRNAEKSENERPSRKPRASETGKPERSARKEFKKAPLPFAKGKTFKDTRRTPQRGAKPGETGDKLIRLNKYLSNAGIASRREADELIKAGAVMVNGEVVTQLGTKILPTDKVQFGDQTIRKEKLVYVLLNKPKGYITTTDDPFDRHTVMSLIADAGRERIYPVGRLDRNTTGLLLFTNDGELAKKLTHPSHKVRKVYHAELDKPLTKSDMLKIGEGIELEDGMAFIDEIAYAEEGKSKREVGIELHSGRNRIVRRIFEALGYEVVRLDRVVFAGLTKKDIPRGHWRFLTEKEVNFLKMIR